MTVPYPRTIFPSGNGTVNSNQVSLRHPKGFTYRCFLPDLTGFVILCCTGPNLQHHFFHSDLEKMSPKIGIRSCCSGLQVQGTANSPPSTAIDKIWRRGRDSNPRDSFRRPIALQAIPL